MANHVDLPAGLRRWQTDGSAIQQQEEGFELALLEDCDNAYRFTAAVGAQKVSRIFREFSRFLPGDAFFILEFYPEEALIARPNCSSDRPAPEVYYSPYVPTGDILKTVSPYLDRMIHDGFVGFGIANNRLGLEFFYSEEKVMTFFTDNHLRLTDFLHRQQIPHVADLVLPADFGHDHLSLLGFDRHLLPKTLIQFSDKELDSCWQRRERNPKTRVGRRTRYVPR